MGYVDDTLGPDERVIRKATFHWLCTAEALLLLALKLAVAAAIYLGGRKLIRDTAAAEGADVAELVVLGFAGVIVLLALYGFLKVMLVKWSTEIAVTDRRLVLKTGWISRAVQELPVGRLEEVNLSQSILGRLFDYGQLSVYGTGGDDALELPSIDAPVAFRQAIAEARAADDRED